jgi:hypothetical protein
MSLPTKYDYPKAIAAYQKIDVSKIADLPTFFRPTNYLCACYFLDKGLKKASFPLGGPTPWSTLCPSCMRYFFADYRGSNNPSDLRAGRRALYIVQGGLREWLCAQKGQFFSVEDWNDEMGWLAENCERKDLSKEERRELRGLLRDSAGFEREICEKDDEVWKPVWELHDRREEEKDSAEKLEAVRRETERVNAEVERGRRQRREEGQKWSIVYGG